MKKEKTKKKLKPKAGAADKKTLIFFEYEVSYEPVKNERYEIPPEIDARMQELYDMVHKTPKKAIPVLEELKVKYPNVPQIYNFLSVAHSIAGDMEKATEAIRENYRKNPDYLFAKINYAEICLNEGKFDEIPVIFDNKFELKMLYPDRKVFHVTEVCGFCGIMGLCCAEIGKQETAETYYKLLKKIAPDHNFTKRLRLKLLVKSFKKNLNLP
ncbi:MAG: hypothetical protein BWK80_59715 [Desulfobacteraceae bacterium IS3]|nr:MAG: hypothetical protein BWK80_59715 [Desulfobacteraceae bacterium IS3]